MTHAALAAEVCSSCGSSLWIGISSVWVSDAVEPAEAEHDHRQGRVVAQQSGRDHARFVVHVCRLHVVVDDN